MPQVSDSLAAELGDLVSGPGDAAYVDALGRIFFPDAAYSAPSCVVSPRSRDDVAATMRIAAEEGAQVTVRGGGLSSLCAADGAVMLDLSAWLNTAVALGDTVRVGGGATMNTLLDALATDSRVVPVGISGSPVSGSRRAAASGT